jgi:5-formyltetrahydrofolate cyclo-ligase
VAASEDDIASDLTSAAFDWYKEQGEPIAALTADLRPSFSVAAMDVAEAKRMRRVELRARRAAIVDPAEQAAAMWPTVISRCRAAGASTVLAFVGVGREPDTTGLRAGLTEAGFTLALPRVEGEHMVAVVARGELTPGAFGIPAPIGEALDPASIDVVVVPGLGFTPDGRRLGQGGGYYDRFLLGVRAGCLTIGVCFRELLVTDLPVEPFDRPVHLVISPDGVVGQSVSAGSSS